MSDMIVRSPKPEWLKVRAPGGENYTHLKEMMRTRRLSTVCEEARCPNIGECWGGGTATIMVMGDTCTRGCRFCNVKTAKFPAGLDPEEPQNVARSLMDMNLEYIVITTVDRDDLPDQGATHFANIVREVKRVNPHLRLETLAGDFQGNEDLLAILVNSGLDVFAHNIETTRALTPRVRDRRATYDQSLRVLANTKKILPSMITKSSIMLGLGETKEDVIQAMKDLRAVDVDILTLGQYMRPTQKHLAVEEYISPQVFKDYENIGLTLGFKYVASGPLVRSSYKAGEVFMKALLDNRERN